MRKCIIFIVVALCFCIINAFAQTENLPRSVDKNKETSNVNTAGSLLGDPYDYFLMEWKSGRWDDWHGLDRKRVRELDNSQYGGHPGCYGYVDTLGNTIIDCNYDALGEFDGVNVYPLPARKNGDAYCVYIDLDGNQVISTRFTHVGAFSEGMATVYTPDKLGYIDTTGRVVITPKFQVAYDFSNGKALVKCGEKHWEFIDKTGRTISTFTYDRVFRLGHIGLLSVIDGKKNGVINESGDEIFPCIYAEGTFSAHTLMSKSLYKDLYNKMYAKALGNDGYAQCLIANLLSRDGLPLHALHAMDIPYDWEEAFKWYLKAAENGVIYAYFKLGFCYAKGYGILKNYAEAIKWFEKDAAIEEKITTWNWLGYLYAQVNNIPKAKEYWRKSAAWHSLYAKDCLSKYEDVVIKNTEIQDIHENNDISIEWLDNVNVLTDKTYKTRACIKSKVRVASVEYYLNNALQTGDRAPSFVENEGCDFVAAHTFILTQGQNDIKIKVTDANGNVAQAAKTVTYNPPSPSPTQREKRLALVIGNNDYAYRTLPTLKNAINDAKAMASQLRNLGYEVPEKNIVLNANKEKMWNAINLFIRESQHYDAALMYYAGHGLSPKGGANYLLPIDARIDYLDEVERDGLNSQTDLLQKLQESSCKVKILLLDCCNNCNVPERDARATNYSGGLSRMFVKGNPEAEGITIIHAAQPGKIAMDGNTNHSPFVSAFLECCQHNADTSWNDFISLVRQKVKENTGEKQIPYREGDIDGVFYLKAK